MDLVISRISLGLFPLPTPYPPPQTLLPNPQPTSPYSFPLTLLPPYSPNPHPPTRNPKHHTNTPPFASQPYSLFPPPWSPSLIPSLSALLGPPKMCGILPFPLDGDPHKGLGFPAPQPQCLIGPGIGGNHPARSQAPPPALGPFSKCFRVLEVGCT